MPKIDNQMKLYHTIVKAMERCSSKEIMKEQEKALGQNALKHTSVSEIVKHVKEGADLTDNHGKFDHKFVRMEELVGEVKEAIEVVLLTFTHWPMISWSAMEPSRKLSLMTSILS